jgi:hypothetical protein
MVRDGRDRGGAMRRPTSHPRRWRVLLAVAWCFAITMLLVIPDIRLLQMAADRSPALMRWAKAATCAAFLLPLPYGVTRLAWALDLPLGIDQDLGRRVPAALPTILGGVAALAITVGGLAFVGLALIGALGLAPEPAEPPAYTGWATWAPGWLWPFWGIALAVATIAYYRRRHDQGRAAAVPHLGQGVPC